MKDAIGSRLECWFALQAQQEAQGLIKRLMSAKIAGQDYDIASLVAVRQVLVLASCDLSRPRQCCDKTCSAAKVAPDLPMTGVLQLCNPSGFETAQDPALKQMKLNSDTCSSAERQEQQWMPKHSETLFSGQLLMLLHMMPQSKPISLAARLPANFCLDWQMI